MLVFQVGKVVTKMEATEMTIQMGVKGVMIKGGMEMDRMVRIQEKTTRERMMKEKTRERMGERTLMEMGVAEEALQTGV